eukprot:4473981-Pyramimonas_sp.AAC.1
MAGAQGALWSSRTAGKMEACAGAAHQGGVGGPLSLVLALARRRTCQPGGRWRTCAAPSMWHPGRL